MSLKNALAKLLDYQDSDLPADNAGLTPADKCIVPDYRYEYSGENEQYVTAYNADGTVAYDTVPWQMRHGVS